MAAKVISAMNAAVVILQKHIMHYRISLYENMHAQLLAHGIELRVVGSLIDPISLAPYIQQHMPYVKLVPCYLMGKQTMYQRKLRPHIQDASLLVLLQSNTYLNAYGLIARHLFRDIPLIAYWGHGKNLQNDSSAFSCWIKDKMLRRVDWWFAYTDSSADMIAQAGFPRDCITALQNAVDTYELRNARKKITANGLQETLKALFPVVGYTLGKIGVYCTHLSPIKKIEFLFQCLDYIHRQMPDFRMIIIGDGELWTQVSEYCKINSWCAWVGAQYGSEKVKYLACADALLNPGMLGLTILDAFAMGIPVITTDNKLHSPEIAYLKNGKNGVMTASDARAFADAVISLLRDSEQLTAMKTQAGKCGEIYTIENMAENFCDGIIKCLEIL